MHLPTVQDTSNQPTADERLLRLLNANVDSGGRQLEADRSWAATFQSLPTTYLRLSANGVVVECQGASGLMRGMMETDLLGRPLAETVLGSAAPAILDARGRVRHIAELGGPRTAIEEGSGKWTLCIDVIPLPDGETAILIQDVTAARMARCVDQEMTDLFAATIDSLPSQVAILDDVGTIIATNRAWDGFSRKLEPGHWLGWNYLEVCARSAAGGCRDAAAVYTGLRDVLKGREPTFHHHHSSGKPMVRHFVLHAVRLAATSRGSVVVSHEETTTTVRSEQHSRLQEQLLRTVLEALPVGVLVIDQDERLLITNPAGRSAFGGPQLRESSRPTYPSTVDSEGSLTNELGAAVTRALAAGKETIESTAEVVCHDGRRRIFTTSVLPIRNEVDDVTGCVMVNQDVTENARAETAIRRSEQMHRAILDSVAEGIVLTFGDGSIAYANRAGEVLLGQSNESMIGRRPEDALGADVGVHFASSPGVREAVVRTESGQSRTYEFASALIQVEPGDAQGAVVSFRDVTQQKDLQSQLAQSQKLEAIGQLAAGIAHEINTPTQYIGDNVRFLRDAFHDIEQLLSEMDALVGKESVAQEQLQKLRDLRDRIDVPFLRKECPLAINQSLDGVDRVTRIVYSMKDFAHPDRREKQAVDLNRVVTSATTVCRNEWKYVADLELDLDPKLPAVLAYASDLGQVVLNLVVNASHAIAGVVGDGAAGKGKIVVRTRAEAGRAELEVSDTGMGIAPQHRPRIFEQFFTTKPVGKGTGQGLALVRRIVVERHGGTVGFDTEVGKGTTFRMTFPIGE